MRHRRDLLLVSLDGRHGHFGFPRRAQSDHQNLEKKDTDTGVYRFTAEINSRRIYSDVLCKFTHWRGKLPALTSSLTFLFLLYVARKSINQSHLLGRNTQKQNYQPHLMPLIRLLTFQNKTPNAKKDVLSSNTAKEKNCALTRSTRSRSPAARTTYQ